MKLVLVRDTFFPDTTLGTLACEDPAIASWQTLEDVDRKLELDPSAKIKGRTAIPRGIYRLTLAYSPRFMRITPRLLDVPGFTGVLIHSGNTHADTSGCILIGETRDGDKILQSRDAMKRLMALLKIPYERAEAMEVEIR